MNTDEHERERDILTHIIVREGSRGRSPHHIAETLNAEHRTPNIEFGGGRTVQSHLG